MSPYYPGRFNQVVAHRVAVDAAASLDNFIPGEHITVWGEFSMDRTRSTVDTLLAATAAIHDLTVVTRNIADFEGLPVQVIHPWAA